MRTSFLIQLLCVMLIWVPALFGQTNYIPKYATPTTWNTSAIYQNGNNIGIGLTNADVKFVVGYTDANQGGIVRLMNGTGYISSQSWSVSNYQSRLAFVFKDFESASYEYASLTVDGKFGVGISTPGSKLTVKGSGTTSGSSGLNITNSSSSSLFFVRDDGKVGIGTSSPTSVLDVNGFARLRATGGWAKLFTDENTYLTLEASHTGGAIRFATGGDVNSKTRFYISPTGNVGIGLNNLNPDSPLEVVNQVSIVSDNGTEGGQLNLANPNNMVGGESNSWSIDNLGGNLRFFYNGGATVPLFISNTTGNVSVGMGSEGATRFHVNGGQLTVSPTYNTDSPGVVTIRPSLNGHWWNLANFNDGTFCIAPGDMRTANNTSDWAGAPFVLTFNGVDRTMASFGVQTSQRKATLQAAHSGLPVYIDSWGTAAGWRNFVGFNSYFDGTNWKCEGDGGNNGGAMIASNWGSGDIYFHTYQSTGTTGQTVTPNYRMTIHGGGGVSINTVNLPTGYHLAVFGKIIAEELQIQSYSNWPDFVFKDGYRLMPLSDLEKSIKENGCLPGMPSAQEVSKDGFAMGDMQAKLLQKIEELTLYVIELKKENEEMKKVLGSKK